jgi:hypothetical protein
VARHGGHADPDIGGAKKRLIALDRALSGVKGAAAPAEWILSLVCEEFGVLPSIALDEPIDPLLEIMRLRSYARAKRMVDSAQSDSDVPGWATEMVFDVQEELHRRRQRAATEA